MSVYVDRLASWGLRLRGRVVNSCHMIADTLEELHEMADAVGMKREWYQPSSFPHYDLTPRRREIAVRKGAIELNNRVDFIRKLREIRNENPRS